MKLLQRVNFRSFNQLNIPNPRNSFFAASSSINLSLNLANYPKISFKLINYQAHQINFQQNTFFSTSSSISSITHKFVPIAQNKPNTSCTMQNPPDLPLTLNPSQNQFLTSAILRHEPNSNRYELKLMYHGKEFNFDRIVSEPLTSLFDRFKAGFSKKFKKLPQPTVFKLKNQDLVVDVSTLTKEDCPSILSFLEKENKSGFEIQIEGESVRVSLNPPEVFKIKFLKKAFVGLPFLPLKIEGSSNFNLENSKFLWEVSSIEESPSSKGTESVKNASEPRVRNLSKEKWTQLSENLILTPSLTSLNKYIRFTIFPSANGIEFGPGSTQQLLFKISELATTPLYDQRVKNLKELESYNCFRVVTYNTLADLLCTQEWFGNSPPEALELDYRLPLLNGELRGYEGDIYCLQEIDEKLFESNFVRVLGSCGSTLDGVYCKKIGETREGLATFFNRTKFSIVKSESETGLSVQQLLSQMDFYNGIFSGLESELEEKLEERNTILQVTVLEQRDNTNLLIVANTHLYYKADADHIRLLQSITILDYLSKKIKKLKNNEKYNGWKIGVLFCGDFNCTPPFSSFRLITTGNISKNEKDWTSHETQKIHCGVDFRHDLNMSTVFKNFELTTMVSKFYGCIDYIFHDENLNVLNSYPPPSSSEIAQIMGVKKFQVSLPNLQAPSDHLPLIADFKFK